MGAVTRDIFKAIHEQKWLAVEYRNKQDQMTRYWIGINALSPQTRTLKVDGLHLRNYQQRELSLRMDSIVSTSLVEGSFHHTPAKLLKAIEEDDRYEAVFGSVPNLKVLDYLYDCARLNQTPYVKDFALVSHVDDQSFCRGAVQLDDEQFSQMVRLLQGNARKDHRRSFLSKQIAINMLSIHTRHGLYVLAYREMRLDVKRRLLAIGRNVLLCREFLVSNGKVSEIHSIGRYLDESDLPMLDNFQLNAEAIRDAVMEHCHGGAKVDDNPHVFCVQRHAPQYLQGEYDAISTMCNEDKATYPIRAFFGNLVRRPVHRKEYPLSLVNQQANLDQLLAINQAVKYPLTYVQGPPGTGKTSTIVNTIVNAFANGQTVLFASFNNHPVDGVFDQLTSLAYDDLTIPFPVLRLGNQHRVAKALDYIKDLYAQTADVHVSRNAPRLGDEQSTERAATLTALLKEYEEQVDLRERRECVQMLAATNDNLNFTVELESQQLAQIDKRLEGMPFLDDLFEQSRQLTAEDHGALMRFLFSASAYDTSPIKNAAPAEADAVAKYAREHPDLNIGVITPFANQRDMIRHTLERQGISNATCGTVHAYQGDEKDVILFSLALTNRTTPGTYKWLTQNRELINVATSRARDKLVVISSSSELARLHATQEDTDDIYELATYVGSHGASYVTPRAVSSRALGVKPYSTKTEEEFLQTLNHALGTIFLAGTKHVVKHEVPIAAVFEEEAPREGLFFSGRFDFVVYEVQPGKVQVPVLAIELDGKEHVSDEVVRRRDQQKEAICARHGFQLIRVENSYARRYHYIKEILVNYFEGK